jgi:hypothetical protein
MTDRFQKKLAVCESDRSRLTEYDWEGLVLIINLLRTAFNEEDAKAHLEYEDWLDTAD